MSILGESILAIRSYFHVFRNPQWSLGQGQGVRVAVIDSGIDPSSLKDFAKKRIVLSRDFAANVLLEGRAKKGAAVLHGTLCAAIILSLAPACDIVDCCITNSDEVDAEALAEAIEWASSEAKADVINVSVGTTRLAFSPKVRKACELAREAGATIVASCSNSGKPSLPSALNDVISIKSIDLGKCGRWCYSISLPNHLIGHSGPYFPRSLAKNCFLSSMYGNSAATASISGQVARLRSMKIFDGKSVYEAMQHLAAAAI